MVQCLFVGKEVKLSISSQYFLVKFSTNLAFKTYGKNRETLANKKNITITTLPKLQSYNNRVGYMNGKSSSSDHPHIFSYLVYSCLLSYCESNFFMSFTLTILVILAYIILLICVPTLYFSHWGVFSSYVVVHDWSNKGYFIHLFLIFVTLNSFFYVIVLSI